MKWNKIPTELFQAQMAKAKKSEIRQYIGTVVKSDNTLEQSHYVSAPFTSTLSRVPNISKSAIVRPAFGFSS
jgi:hypothetical protein